MFQFKFKKFGNKNKKSSTKVQFWLPKYDKRITHLDDYYLIQIVTYVNLIGIKYMKYT